MVSMSFFYADEVLSSSALPLSSLSILITSVLNSASGRLLVSILFSSFSRAFFFFHLGHVPLSSHFVCSLCFFYVLGRASMSPGLLVALRFDRFDKV